jgi:hypothetical protein
MWCELTATTWVGSTRSWRERCSEASRHALLCLALVGCDGTANNRAEDVPATAEPQLATAPNEAGGVFEVLEVAVGQAPGTVRRHFQRAKTKYEITSSPATDLSSASGSIGGIRATIGRYDVDQDLIDVDFIGLPGAERAHAIERMQWFRTGEEPSVEAFKAALIQKYGSPSLVRHESEYLPWILAWVRPADAQKPTKPEVCIQDDVDEAVFREANCGETAYVELFPSGNARLLRNWRVEVSRGVPGFDDGQRFAVELERHVAAVRAKEREEETSASNARAGEPNL